MTSYRPPGLTVEVTATDSPWTLPDDCTSWIDLSDRVISFNMQRGRNDRTAAYEPGTCTVVFNNDDRMLDPEWSGSLIYGQAYPLSQIRVRAEYASDTWEVFTGYIGPDAWVCDPFGRGLISTSTVQAYDRMGLFQTIPLPSSPYAALVTDLLPDWWVRGNADSSVLQDTYGVPDVTGTAGATVYDSGGGELVYVVESMAPDDNNPALLCKAGAKISHPQASLFPSGAVASTTYSCIWRGTPAGSDQNIMRLNSSDHGSGFHRWQVYCNSSGEIVVVVYDNSGVGIAFDVMPANPLDGGGRWDNDTPHLITFRLRGGSTEAKAWADDQSVTITDPSIPGTPAAGYLINGSASADVRVDEIAMWRSALTSTDAANLYKAFLKTGQPFKSDDFPTRIARLWSLAGFPTDATEQARWYSTGSDPDLWGLGSVNSMSSSLADEIQSTVASYFGAAYCSADGRVTCHTRSALDDPPFDTEYAYISDEGDSTGTETFSYTGATQTWTVPGGVTEITVTADGAAGGSRSTTTSTGGLGARVVSTLTVNPGDLVRVNVGGAGASNSGATGGAGGWNGGGDGGAANPLYSPAGGAGGGGATDVRIGGSTLAHRQVVAAGGGGSGGRKTTNAGDHSGGAGGTNGTRGKDGSGISSGTAATPSAAGSDASSGSLGTGGNGSSSSSGGGGGGGGVYGGGGGYGAAGTGDGNSTGGGGGSSMSTGTGTTITDGSNSGDGAVTITWSRTIIRHGPIIKTGQRLNRLITAVDLAVGSDEGGDNPTRTIRLTAEDHTASNLYGRRAVSVSSAVLDADWAITSATAYQSTWGSFVVEVGDVEITAWGDYDATAFALTLELEKLVTLVDSPPHGDALSTQYRVQGIEWDWQDGTDWTVTINLGNSR